MRTLILSCNTGEGHNSCAKAIEEYYLAQGESCRIEDGLQYISHGFSRFISWGHSFVYKYLPWLFCWGYGCAERHPSAFLENTVIYRILTCGTEQLYQYIKENQFDAVICTHVFTALMVTDVIKKYQPSLVTGFVATDYTCSPSAKDGRLDYYFIPDEKLTDEFTCENIPKEKIIVSGIPVRQMFYTQYTKTEAKMRVGVKTSRHHLLFMCGSMGCGPMEKLLRKLAESQKENYEITVVCGRNEKLKKRLEKSFGQSQNIHIRGYVKDMSLLMDSADLYLTKPGGLSTSEAAVKELPMLLIDTVAGCEEYNCRFFVEKGYAKTGNNLKKLTEICAILMEDDKRLYQMKNCLAERNRHHAAREIFEKMKEGTKKDEA